MILKIWRTNKWCQWVIVFGNWLQYFEACFNPILEIYILYLKGKIDANLKSIFHVCFGLLDQGFYFRFEYYIGISCLNIWRINLRHVKVDIMILIVIVSIIDIVRMTVIVIVTLKPHTHTHACARVHVHRCTHTCTHACMHENTYTHR